jgi:hypothetical protein
MMTYRHGRLALGAVALLAGTGAGVTYHKARPGCLCGLPCYDYVYGNPQQVVSAFSLDPVPLERTQVTAPGAPAGLVRERVKFFQLAQTRVELEHCALSQVAVTLHESGEWTLSLRAEQNWWMTGPKNEVSTPVQLPGAVTAQRPPIPNLAKETEGLKRNLFTVRVRCYGGYPLRDALPAAAPGKPVLFELPPAQFWVQRGVPYTFWAKQPLPAAAQFFDLVDRVEVELSIR